MPHDNTPVPAALVAIGLRDGGDLYGTPRAGQHSVPGTAGIILGYTVDGQPVIIATTSLEWLDDLVAAAQHARARGIVQAGMKAKVPA